MDCFLNPDTILSPTMAWLTSITFLCLFHLFMCDCVINHQTLEEAWEKKLHKDLKRDYRWFETPNPCNITEVKANFLMNSFILDSDSDLFTMYSILSISWTDKRLQWNASDYGGLKRTYFQISKYWIPFVELNNGDDVFGYTMLHDQCSASDYGHVACMLKIEYSAQCATRISDWPFDTQKCPLEFRITKRENDQVHLLPRGKRAVIRRGEATRGSKYTIVGYHQETNASAEVQIRITFVLQRNGESLAAIITIPSILLSILTTSSIVLDVNDRNRFLMTLFSMLCHFFYLQDIGWEIPRHDADPPSVLLFYRSSLIMTLLLVIATVILGKLRNKESAPPPWVSSVYSIVLNSHGKYFVWPRWNTNIELLTSDDVDVKVVDVWNGFANIVNSVCFFVTVLVYSIMILVCVPKQQKYTYEANNNSLFFAEDNF